MAESAIGPLRRRARLTLLTFLAVSVAAHAAVLIIVPQFARDTEPARNGVLSVAILQPEPLPVSPVEPDSRPPSSTHRPRASVSATSPNAGSGRPATTVVEPEAPPAGREAFALVPPAQPESPNAPAARQAEPGVAPIVSAAYLRNPAPRYPSAAQRAGEQGTVTLRVLVTREGLATRVNIEKSSGSPHLDAAAIEAVKAWRFVPARQGADAVDSWMRVPIVFRLEAAS